MKLPVEVWRDCFDWLSPKDRKQVARKLNDINDYEFINLCEKWLHEWTKNVCLGPLYIGDSGLACVQCWNEQMQRFELEEFPIAETEMPVNIKSFNWIIISYLDTKVLQFLRRLQPLFRDVSMHVSSFDDEQKWEAAKRTTLVHLLPLLTGGIETIRMISRNFPTIRDLCTDQQFFGFKQLEVWDMFKPEELTDEFIKLILLWLGTRRDDGQPRILLMPEFHANALELVESIRQHFLHATSAVSFCIQISKWDGHPDIHQSTIHNVVTQEQLMVRSPAESNILICRCTSEEDGQGWMNTMSQEFIFENRNRQNREISIAYPKLGFVPFILPIYKQIFKNKT